MKYRTDDIISPPIVKLSEAAKRYVASPDFLDLGQGLPGHIPPKKALDALSERILHPSLHQYTPDQGLIELREELSLYLHRTSGIRVDPNDELAIAAGANQAFVGAIMAILRPGENVVVPTPFYFNSVMAIQLVGGEVKMVPTRDNLQPSYDDIAAAIDVKTKAILLITPNNPTGAVYDKELLDQIVDLCIEKSIWLISDETYARLVFDGQSHYSPRSRKDASSQIIVLGSFSKDFGMSGWRVGYIIAPSDFINEFIKVQDTITICAPTAGQILAHEILKGSLEHVEHELDRLRTLRDLAYVRINEIERLECVRTAGTFYLFPEVAGCTDSRSLVMDILKTAKMLVLPGSIFGQRGEGYLRISIGPLTPEAVDESFDRLATYFSKPI